MLLLIQKWKYCNLKDIEEDANMYSNYIFHVHTRRCKHASDENDEEYIRRALQLGANEIVYTDHAPFPGDPFTNRMDYGELEEYIDSIHALKKKYRGKIEVHVGLEIEYLPSYINYYKDLKNNSSIDLLMIGQHHYEVRKNIYSYMLDNKTMEHIGIVNAMLQGMDTGLFDVIAHPDRAFRRVKEWTSELTDLSNKIIQKAIDHNIGIEKNYRSIRQENQFREEFWKLVPNNARVVYGCDAHRTNELVLAQDIKYGCIHTIGKRVKNSSR